MELTFDEKRILGGEDGDVLRKSMELLIAIGEAFDAPRMIDVNSVHITSVALNTLREAGKGLIEKIANSGARFKVFTTVNPLATDYTQWEVLGISKEELLKQLEVVDTMRKAGAILCHTCTPYLVGNIPRFGEHIAWGEASAVIFANSVLGAMTNPEGGPSGLASALTGRTPLYGLHLEENRVGQFIIRVNTALREPTEYGALVLFGGRVHKELIPVFVNLPQGINWDALKMMSAILHSVSSAKMFHAVGITPEAKTEEQALGGKKAVDVIDFGKKELEKAIQSLDQATKADVDLVYLGCPHCSINEIREIVKEVNGRKVNSNVSLWVSTSLPVKALADRMGFSEVIEQAGGKIISETCPVLFTNQTIRNLGFQSLTTNSADMAFVFPMVHGLKAHFGRLGQCINAAVSGTWE